MECFGSPADFRPLVDLVQVKLPATAFSWTLRGYSRNCLHRCCGRGPIFTSAPVRTVQLVTHAASLCSPHCDGDRTERMPPCRGVAKPAADYSVLRIRKCLVSHVYESKASNPLPPRQNANTLNTFAIHVRSVTRTLSRQAFSAATSPTLVRPRQCQR